MPQYRKKNVRRSKMSAKNVIYDDVVMKKPKKQKQTPEETRVEQAPPQRKKISVIRGNKVHNRNKRIAILTVCLLFLASIITVSFLTPTGIVESLVNFSATMKFGTSYPVKLSGGNLLNVVPQGNHMFLLSTTNFECYNNNGKNIFSYQHGYLSPAIAVSSARTLIYDQSGKGYGVYNLNSELITGTTEREILTADIARNGNFVLATLSDSYSSQLTVYNKNGNKIFEWFCAEYTINNVILSPDGESVVVSAISASDGSFVSRLDVLDINSDSAESVVKYNYDGLILGIKKSGNKGFSCVCENSVDFFTWKDFKVGTFSTEENILISRNHNSNTLIVSGRPANKNENRITVFDEKGVTEHSFVFKGIIDSIEYKGTDVYILSEKTVYHYSVSGDLIENVSCDFGTRYILPVSQKEIAAISDNNIVKLAF